MLRRLIPTCVVVLLVVLLGIGHVNALGSWSPTTSYPTSIYTQSCVVDSGYVYCIGGINSTLVTNAVYSAPLSTGGVGSWSPTTSYPVQVIASCVADAGYVYCIGGADKTGAPTNAVYSAPLSAGSVGSWSSTTSYPTDVYLQSCVVDSGYIYCIGGFDNSLIVGTNVVYSAPLSAGSVGPWSSTTSYPTDISDQSCVVDSGYVYCIAGDANASETNAVYSAPVSAGSVGSWSSTTPYSTSLRFLRCVVGSGSVYCIGGLPFASTTNAVYSASLSAGSVGSWSSTASYPTDISNQSCVVDYGYVYCIGGFVSGVTNAVYYTQFGTTPSISSTVSPSNILIGNSASDLATPSGGYSPSGTVICTAYSDSACTVVAFTDTEPLGTPSAAFTPSAVGTYYWTASYSGDTNNPAVSTVCGALGETLTVNKWTPVLVDGPIFVAPGVPVERVPVGSVVYDTATLSGGFPGNGVTGTVSYTLYADASCDPASGPNGIPEGTVVVGPGNFVGPSNNLTLATPGSYSFQAMYSGDANNSPVMSGCESLTVTLASPTITTAVLPSSSVSVGTPVSDQAVITGGYPASGVTGVVTYSLYSTGSCSGALLFTQTIAVGPGNFVPATSPIVEPSAANYSFVAVYSGDSNNNPATSACETFNVTDFTLSASPSSLSIIQGAAASSTVTVTSLGGFSGTVTLTLAASPMLTVTLTPSSVIMSGSAILTANTTLTTPTGSYLVNVTGSSGGLVHESTVTVTILRQTVAPPLFFVTWQHRLSLSNNRAVETWSYLAFNLNENKTIYAAIIVTGTDSAGTTAFVDTTPIFMINSSQLVSGSISQTFTNANLGQSYQFIIAIRWGTTATTNPKALPFIGLYTISGSFTITS